MTTMMMMMFAASMMVIVVESSTASVSPPTTPISINKNKNKKRLTEDTMNANLLKMEYAVRGTVVIAADRINEELRVKQNEQSETENSENENKESLPPAAAFSKIIYTNIGNPQSVGQQPLTWPRQVCALVDLPDAYGVDHPDATKLFPLDAIRRAKEIKVGLGGHGSGAYSHSKGIKLFREDAVSFLQQRDGPEVPTDVEDLFFSNGASAAITNLLTALISDSTW